MAATKAPNLDDAQILACVRRFGATKKLSDKEVWKRALKDNEQVIKRYTTNQITLQQLRQILAENLMTMAQVDLPKTQETIATAVSFSRSDPVSAESSGGSEEKVTRPLRRQKRASPKGVQQAISVLGNGAYALAKDILTESKPSIPKDSAATLAARGLALGTFVPLDWTEAIPLRTLLTLGLAIPELHIFDPKDAPEQLQKLSEVAWIDIAVRDVLDMMGPAAGATESLSLREEDVMEVDVPISASGREEIGISKTSSRPSLGSALSSSIGEYVEPPGPQPEASRMSHAFPFPSPSPFAAIHSTTPPLSMPSPELSTFGATALPSAPLLKESPFESVPKEVPFSPAPSTDEPPRPPPPTLPMSLSSVAEEPLSTLLPSTTETQASLLPNPSTMIAAATEPTLAKVQRRRTPQPRRSTRFGSGLEQVETELLPPIENGATAWRAYLNAHPPVKKVLVEQLDVFATNPDRLISDAQEMWEKFDERIQLVNRVPLQPHALQTLDNVIQFVSAQTVPRLGITIVPGKTVRGSTMREWKDLEEALHAIASPLAKDQVDTIRDKLSSNAFQVWNTMCSQWLGKDQEHVVAQEELEQAKTFLADQSIVVGPTAMYDPLVAVFVAHPEKKLVAADDLWGVLTLAVYKTSGNKLSFEIKTLCTAQAYTWTHANGAKESIHLVSGDLKVDEFVHVVTKKDPFRMQRALAREIHVPTDYRTRFAGQRLLLAALAFISTLANTGVMVDKINIETSLEHWRPNRAFDPRKNPKGNIPNNRLVSLYHRYWGFQLPTKSPAPYYNVDSSTSPPRVLMSPFADAFAFIPPMERKKSSRSPSGRLSREPLTWSELFRRRELLK